MIRAMVVPCVLLAGAMAACSSSQQDSTATTTAAASPPVTTAAADDTSGQTGEPTGTPTTGAPTTPADGPVTCTGEMLSGQIVAGGGGAAGHTGVRIEFTNTSSQECSMRGFPGVSFVGDNNGTQIGAPAQREEVGSEATINLPPGGTASAALLIANAGNYDASTCEPTPTDGFRVYPPNSTTAIFIPDTDWTGCASTSIELLSVQPVTSN